MQGCSQSEAVDSKLLQRFREQDQRSLTDNRHVWLNRGSPKAWVEATGKPSLDEEDMLDLAFGLEATSRLGCQITMTPALDGLKVRLPEDD